MEIKGSRVRGVKGSVAFEPSNPGTLAPSKRKVYTITELTREIQLLLEEQYPEVWVEGEVSNLTLSAKGHTYFSLKDETALLKCVLFLSNSRSVKFKLENGLKVLCFGQISTYPPRGEYQLVVEAVEPKGLGALQLAFEQLKKKLEKEGLFDVQRKRVIPFLPDRIGIVTSLSGKAIRDILKVIGERFPESWVVIRDVRVQGEGAAEEIAEGIRDLNTLKDVDVLLVGRGGGSIEDLWAFNEEVVARAIYTSKIPVVSCVGHELDYTIADFVADVRAGTPSMAAEMAVPDQSELLERVEDYRHRLRSSLMDQMAFLTERLRSLKESVSFRKPERLFAGQEQRLDELTTTLRHLSPLVLIREAEGHFRVQIAKLETLSPLKTLERGFSVTYGDDGTILRNASSLSTGDSVKTRLYRGSFVSRVEKIEERGEDG